MRTYDMILQENIPLVSKERLAEMYNDAVEEIWYLFRRNAELHEENEMLWNTNEELSNQLFG